MNKGSGKKGRGKGRRKGKKGKGMEVEGNREVKEKRRGREKRKMNQVEKWEGGKGNQVSGNFIHPFLLGYHHHMVPHRYVFSI